ncbi:biliverdin-producing heme oxygenase [Ameyamaea chiangmaiensis]|uniref:Biliverdin-producing heme oxygenase n=1 Tax=Ameyamaea chiangmaiensis TaxID=442969 RepID=A0A850PB32_9PROT|nr:biliverdin-producing heme oxygenase [Ameyamaea chiangmaiensis]NVN41284.1 biliverdin-producing heme oxygenase [Ameyamaea chiangmaiensis]
MAVGARRFALRDGTRTGHETLDHMVGTLTDAGAYARYLRGMEAFRSHAEQALARGDWSDLPVAVRPRPIAPALRDDLSALGLSPVAVAIAPLRLDSRSALLGGAYVLEGSAMGARLLRQQALALGFDREHGARHLAEQTDGSSWRAFVEALDTAPDYDGQQALAAAQAMFDTARAAFRALDTLAGADG